MNPVVGLAAAIGAGAGLMFLLDPQAGNRRRALLRDKLRRYTRKGRARAEALGEMATDHVKGAVAETRARFAEGEVDDRTLEARVRSEMGRWVSHPGSIHVAASNGRVTLSGQILRAEEIGLLTAVRSVRGVKGIENRLQAHDRAGSVPGVQ